MCYNVLFAYKSANVLNWEMGLCGLSAVLY